jgi:hypothetical protein
MQASVAGQLTEKASQAVDPEPKSSLETDHADSKVISRDFFWDQLIKLLTSGMLLIAALDIITSLTTEPVKCQAPNHFTRDQSAFVNSYCSEKTPKVDYFLFYIVGQAIVLVGPHVLWRSWFSGKLAHFMSVSLSLDRHRSNDTGEYVQDNFVKLKVLETSFGKSKVMHRAYFAKVLLQFLCIFVACVCSWAPFYEPQRKLFRLFHPVFDCQYTGPPTDYPNLENYIFNVKCVVPALRSHYAVWIINFILLGGTIICLCFAIVWWTIPHKLLNWRDATMFSLQSGIGHDHYHNSTMCPFTFRIRTDLDFLLLRLYDQDEGYGNVLHELLIISKKADIMHKAKETLSLIRGNEATGKADSDPSGKPIKFRVKAIGPTVVKASWKPPVGRTVSLYVISYRKASDPERLNKEEEIKAQYYKEVDNEYKYEIRELHPLTSYLFTIRGDSTADSDAEKGDPTLPLSLLTPSEKEWKLLSKLSPLIPTIILEDTECKYADGIFKDFKSSQLMGSHYALTDVLLSIARSEDYGVSKNSSVIAVDLTFGGDGYSIALVGIRDDCKMVSLNLDPNYLNEKKSSDHRTFDSGIHTIKTLTDIYAQPSQIGAQFSTDFIARCLQEKEKDVHYGQAMNTVQFFVVGPFTDPDRVMTVHWFLYFLVRGGFVDFNATLIVIRPIQVGGKDVKHKFQDFRAISPWGRKMQDSLKLKCGNTTCIFRISLYKVTKWPCGVCEQLASDIIDVTYDRCKCVDKVCKKCEPDIPEEIGDICLNHRESVRIKTCLLCKKKMPESVDIMYEDCNCTISVCRECEGDIPSKIGPVCSKHPQNARKDN